MASLNSPTVNTSTVQPSLSGRAALPRLFGLGVEFVEFLRSLFDSQYVLCELTKKDLRSRYLGSYLGFLWAFIQPVVTVAIFWFVFENGLKSKPVADYPFILWLVAGIVPWFFFSEGLSRATTAIVENGYLVKKVVFRVSLLPIVKLLSALVIHLLFLMVAAALFAVYGNPPTVYLLQLGYYLTATCVLLLGMAWATSGLMVLARDLGQIVAMTLQLGFWLTPICWPAEMVPERFRALVTMNPVFYLVQGYRDCMIHHVWFWERGWETVWFWLVSIAFLFGGGLLFKRLRPHFADLL